MSVKNKCTCYWEDAIYREIGGIFEFYKVKPLPKCSAEKHVNYDPRDVVSYFCDGHFSPRLRIYAHDVFVTFREHNRKIVMLVKREKSQRVVCKGWDYTSSDIQEFLLKNIPKLVDSLYKDTSPTRVYIPYASLNH